MDRLYAWKHSSHRMPLLLDGARQVGKTYTALTFGREQYKNTVYFNMEDSQELQTIFERDFNMERMLRELSAIGNNVNQLAHQANARGEATRQEITEAAMLVRQAWRLVKGSF